MLVVVIALICARGGVIPHVIKNVSLHVIHIVSARVLVVVLHIHRVILP